MPSWWLFLIELAVVGALMYLMWWLGYRQGYRAMYDTKLEDALRAARRKASLTKAEAEALGVLRPRSRPVRIKGTSRRDLNS